MKGKRIISTMLVCLIGLSSMLIILSDFGSGKHGVTTIEGNRIISFVVVSAKGETTSIELISASAPINISIYKGGWITEKNISWEISEVESGYWEWIQPDGAQYYIDFLNPNSENVTIEYEIIDGWFKGLSDAFDFSGFDTLIIIVLVTAGLIILAVLSTVVIIFIYGKMKNKKDYGIQEEFPEEGPVEALLIE